MRIIRADYNNNNNNSNNNNNLFIQGILITKEWSSKEPCALNLVEKKAKTEITNIIKSYSKC